MLGSPRPSFATFSLATLLFALASCGGSDGGDNADAGGDADAADDGPDRDGDGISDADEEVLGTDPDNADSDGDGIIDGDELDLGTDPTNPDSDGDGVLDGDELELGTDPTEVDDACAESESAATLTKQPIDLILVVDTSSSMDDEIDAIQANLNTNLASALTTAELDYRVILLGEYPGSSHAPPPGASAADKLDICISTPLGGAVCTCTGGSNCVDGSAAAITGAPVMTERFKHYDVLIDSHDGLRRIVNDYDQLDEQGNPGWGTYLREGAQRVFIFISDDDETGIVDFASFQNQLIAKDASFGTMDTPTYKFHAILGQAARAMPDQDQPWLPGDPVVATECTPDADDEGTVNQGIAIASGGLRFPICAEDNFDVIFAQIASDVVEGSALDCEFTPEPPSNGTLDFSKMVVYYTPDGADTPTKFTKVADEAACAADSYFVDEDLGVVTICQTACDVIQDVPGQLAVHVACDGPGGVN